MATLPKKPLGIEAEGLPPRIAASTPEGTPSTFGESSGFIGRSVLYWFRVQARVRSLADEHPLQFVAGVAVLAFSVGIVLKVTGRGRHE